MDDTPRKSLSLTGLGSSLSKRDNASLRQALSDRMLLSEALDHVRKLLAGFPNGGANAGDGYLGALAATLAEYPRMVAVKCCSPVHGVSRETRFLPTVADVVAFCERETQAMRGPIDREDAHDHIVEQMMLRRKDDAQLEADRKTRPTYDDLKAKYGDNWGLSKPDPLRPNASKERLEIIQRSNEVLHKRELEAAGLPADSNVSAALYRVLHPDRTPVAE